MKAKIILFLLVAALLSALNYSAEISRAGSMSANDSTNYIFEDKTQENIPINQITGRNMDVKAADLNGDGFTDLVLAREFQPNILLYNNGDGTFYNATAGRLPQFNYDSEDIGVADFNNDGFPDLVFISEDTPNHEFYLNDGTGTFHNFNNRIPQGTSNALLVIDLNNDGFPDMIIGNEIAGNPSFPALNTVLINNGDTTFKDESFRLPQVPDIPQDIKSADLNGDGFPDLVFGNEDGNKILINNGNGEFIDETNKRLPLIGNEETRKVVLTDVNNDGYMDILFANVSFRPGMNMQNRFLINDGQGFFSDETSLRLPFDFEHTLDGVFIDLNFDGWLDLITINAFSTTPMKIFINDTSGFFIERTSELIPQGIVFDGISITASDLNKDSLEDLFITNYKTGTQPAHYTDRLLVRIDTTSTGVSSGTEIAPGFKLYQNYPNPFNPSTVVGFQIAVISHVRLKLYDMLGNEVAVLVNEVKPAGDYQIEVNSIKYNLPSGVYYYKMTSGDFSDVKKMLLIK